MPSIVLMQACISSIRSPAFTHPLRCLLLLLLSLIAADSRAQGFSSSAASPALTNYSGFFVADGGALSTLAVTAARHPTPAYRSSTLPAKVRQSCSPSSARMFTQ